MVSRGRAYRFGVGRACSEHGSRSEDGRQRGSFSTQDKWWKSKFVAWPVRALEQQRLRGGALYRGWLVLVSVLYRKAE